ncbi:MAG: lipopolysaccharide kinase InaA family protein [Planctomycetaceae bacterium]
MQTATRITSPDFRADPGAPGSWIAAERELLRSLPGRRVFRADAGGLGVVVKEYRPAGLLDRWRNRAGREADRAIATARRGVPVVEPLATARLPDGREWLFLREVEGARTLKERVLGGGLAGAQRHDLARRTGALWARLHGAGIRHTDPHAGNILVRPDGALLFADAGALRPGHYLREEERVKDLAAFALFFVTRASRSDLLLFWGSYGRGASLTPEALERFRGMVERELPAAFRRLARRRARAELRRAIPFSMEGFAGRVLPGIDATRMRAIVAFARSPHADPSVLKRSASGWTFRAGDTHVAKLYLPKRIHRPWFDLVRGSRAVRAHRAAHALRHRGLATPRIAAVLEEGRPPTKSLLVMERVNDARPLEEALASLPAGEGKALAARLGRRLRRMHDWGLRQRDLKKDNLFVAAGSGEIVFLDLDGVSERRASALPWVLRARDLGNLAASLRDRRAVPTTLRLRLLDAYLGSTGLEGVTNAAFARAVAREAAAFRARRARAAS